MRPRLLDLFCGAGGAAVGYHRAGFEVVGVDIRPQPNYPFAFIQADALEVLDLFGQRAGDRCTLVGGESTDAEFADAVVVRTDLDSCEDGVGDFVGVAAVRVGDGHIQVDEDGAGHGSSLGDGDSEILTGSGASSKVGDGDTFLPALAPGSFQAIHASPPCQRFSAMRVMANAREHPDLLTPTRERLHALEVPYVIENVPGAPMATVLRLCGTSFGLGVEVYDGWRQLLRHRYFETSFSMLAPPCQHVGSTVGLYGDHLRDRRRKGPNGKGRDFPDRDKLRLGSAAMGIDWMTWDELKEAIPPAYTELIGLQLLEHIRVAA